MKLLFIIFISVFFSSCISSNNIDIQKDFSSLQNNKKFTVDFCSDSSFINNIKTNIYGDLFIENISLNNNCQWNGLSRGFFEDLFRKSLNIKKLQIIERFNFSNIEFTTYLVDDKFYVNLIYQYLFNKDIFILDYKGIYSEEKIKIFNKDYKNKYISKNRFTEKYSLSLVNKNIVNGYFSKIVEP